MRSFILVIVAAFVLGVGGLVYFWMQPSRGTRGGAKGPISSGDVTLPPDNSGSTVGKSDNLQLKKFSQVTGELLSEFMADRYTPQKGGKIAVTNAVARFYLADGQVLQIHGDTGLFSGDNETSAPKNSAAPQRAQAPTRGHLNDVTLQILDKTNQPTMTLTMNNASFDSESSTIYTDPYFDEVTKQDVPADQVKVTIRSVDTGPNAYDFDGRGLRIAWNERDKRLAKLDIAHGESLVIKNPKGFSQPKGETNAAANGAGGSPAHAPSAEKQPTEKLAVAPASGPAPALKHGQMSPNLDPPLYRASFRDNVRIVQNGQPLATAEKMSVDFWMQSGGQASGKPATQATSQPIPTPATQAIASATTQKATTRPADEMPLYIYWTGPLHVEPYAQAAVPPGDSIVTLEGTPVVARQQASEIHASKLVYRTEDGSLHGVALPGALVTMTSADAHGESVIRTTALEYLARAQPPVAILSGKSTADLPAQADGTKMKASWADRCSLRFEALPDGRTAIKQADIAGDVFIDHPQIKLNSQRLELSFDVAAHGPATKPVALAASQPATNPATQPSPLMQTNLKQLIASDAVRCQMKDSAGNAQTIDCNTLTLLTDFTPDGKLAPRTVNADGSVHAVDVDQDLRAGHLAVTLVPSTRPSATKPAAASDGGFGGNVDLQSMIAHDAVHVIGKKDGTEAFADTMLVDKKDGKTTVKFVGQPFAKIIQKNNVVTGPVIDLSPDGQQMSVDGGGTMHGSQQETPGATAKPIDVAWTRSLRVDGKRNIVDAAGDVVAKSVDADGSVNTARGDRAQLLLVDVPTTRPTTQTANAAATTPSTQQTVIKKNVRQAIFQDNASVSSTLLDNEGLPLRRMNLFASTIQYDVLSDGTGIGPATKKMTVPVGGKMLVEDYRPATTKPATKPAQAAGGMSDMAGARGATAFQWSKSLVYDDATHKAVMDGNVVINHRDDVNSDASLRLTGDTVAAELEPAPATQPSTQPTEPRYQVRRITGHGNIVVTMRGGELLADSFEYNPLTRVLIARGTENVDAVFSRAGAGASQPIRALEMQWDAKTDLPKITRASAQMRR